MVPRVRVALLPWALLACFTDSSDPGDSTSGPDSGSDSGEPVTTGPLAICGNGALEPGEGCDDGPANAVGAACKPDCFPNICGDGVLGPGELCDDGNTRDDDTCNNNCGSNCGNDVVNAGEACDDGNQIEDDACTSRCLPPTCGDGLLQESFGEECDDGPDNGYTAACTGVCKQARCGDGFVGPIEQCDPGDNQETADCDFDCRTPICGDDKVNEAALEDCEGPGPFAKAMCLSCQFACDPGFGDCTHDDVDDKGNDLGCETDLSSTAAHCGQCGKPCPEGQACVAGGCA